MKTKLLLFFKAIIFFALSISSCANAQVTEIFRGLEHAGEAEGMEVVGNKIFFINTTFNGDNYESSYISMINLTASNLVNQKILENLNRAWGMTKKGGSIYVTETLENKRIFKFSHSESNPTIVPVLSNLPHYPISIDGNAKHIFFVTLDQADNNRVRILRFDNSQSSPVATVVVDNPGFLRSMMATDNNVFFSNHNKKKIYWIDANATTATPQVFLNTQGEPNNLTKYGDYLYWEESGKLKRVDLSTTIITVEDIMDLQEQTTYTEGNITYSSTPDNMTFDSSGNLYVLAHDDGRLYKVDASALSVNSFAQESDNLEVYPNPTTNFVILKGLNKNQNYKLTDTNGRLVKSGIIERSGRINLEGMISGIYFLQVDNKTYKIIKK